MFFEKVLQQTLQRLLDVMELVPRSKSLHYRISQWAEDTFGKEVVLSKEERAWRFFEESLELAHAAGITKEDALAMLEEEFSKTPGDVKQEAADVRITLAVLCVPWEVDLERQTEKKLRECIANKQKILAKQKTKTFSVFPKTNKPA